MSLLSIQYLVVSIRIASDQGPFNGIGMTTILPPLTAWLDARAPVRRSRSFYAINRQRRSTMRDHVTSIIARAVTDRTTDCVGCSHSPSL